MQKKKIWKNEKNVKWTELFEDTRKSPWKKGEILMKCKKEKRWTKKSFMKSKNVLNFVKFAFVLWKKKVKKVLTKKKIYASNVKRRLGKWKKWNE